MRNTFVNTLLALAREDPRIVLITGDLGFGVLTRFWQELPEQFINAGIAEQSMTGIATGLAMEGRIVFTYSIANFPTLRCLEQIRNDAAYHGANLKIVSIGAGMAYGASGMSHHATEDIAVMRALPDITVLSPGDPHEARVLTRRVCEWPGTCYIRLGKGGEKNIHHDGIDFMIGDSVPIFTHGPNAVFACGSILANCHDAVTRLNQEGKPTRLYSFPSVKPLNTQRIQQIARETKVIVTVEEHNLSGGFGSAVSEILAEMSEPHACLRRIGIPDRYTSTVGSQEFLRGLYGLSSEAIYKVLRA